MQLDSPQLGFPAAFCCNCGDTDCMSEIQDTRVTRYFGIGGTETTFKLPVPVCAACRRSTRRRPPGFFARLLVLALAVERVLPGAGDVRVDRDAAGVDRRAPVRDQRRLALAADGRWSRLRRPKPPKTSFYQPVRIKEARVQVTGLMSGYGQVAFMKLAFTNPDYLNVFVEREPRSHQGGSTSPP